MEPHVDAINVEAVVALGQNPTAFVLFKLGQTNRAFHGFPVGLGRIEEDGESFNHGRVETVRGSDGGLCTSWVGRVYIEDKWGVSAVVVVITSAAASSEEVPASVKVKTDHYNDNAEQNDDGAEHNLTGESIALGFRIDISYGISFVPITDYHFGIL